MRIGIIGAGMGGLAAASLLADQGHVVSVFDKFDKPKPVGSGLVIQPVGQQVLAEIGVLDRAVAAGNRVTRMLGYDADSGRTVLDVTYDLVDPNAFGLALHRSSLFDALWHGVMARPHVSFIANADVTSLRQDDDGVEVFTSDHTVIGPFDLVVDSAGAGSPLSPLVAKPLSYGAVWGTLDWPDTVLPKHHLSQRYVGAHHMIGALPIGRLPGDDGFKAAIFWSLPANGHAEWQNRGVDAWRKQTAHIWPDFAPFADQITDPSQMTMANYSHGTLNRPYSGRVVHIGDAAHRASPQLGQGANMALLDAQALARSLQTRDIGRALPAYARARRWHTKIYQAMSWAFTPMYQSDSRLLPLIRDRALFPASQIPPVPRLLTSLVCGTMVSPIGRL